MEMCDGVWFFEMYKVGNWGKGVCKGECREGVTSCLNSIRPQTGSKICPTSPQFLCLQQGTLYAMEGTLTVT